jgi:hypothetical protein
LPLPRLATELGYAGPEALLEDLSGRYRALQDVQARLTSLTASRLPARPYPEQVKPFGFLLACYLRDPWIHLAAERRESLDSRLQAEAARRAWRDLYQRVMTICRGIAPNLDYSSEAIPRSVLRPSTGLPADVAAQLLGYESDVEFMAELWQTWEARQRAQAWPPPSLQDNRLQLVAPFETDAQRWTKMPWFDRYSGRSYRITTMPVPLGVETEELPVKTIADVLAEYQVHPEPKSLGPDGLACHQGSIGLLSRRPVRALLPPRLIGKEGNRLEERVAGLASSTETVAEYQDPASDPWLTILLLALRSFPIQALAATADLPESTVKYIRAGRRPSSQHRARLTLAAGRLASQQVDAWTGAETATAPPWNSDKAVLVCARYLAERPQRTVCRFCAAALSRPDEGQPVDPRRRYCSQRCRQRAARSRPRQSSRRPR